METILLVDADSALRRQLEPVLTGDGYRLETAGSAREAVALGCRRGYDLLLCDMGLPEGSSLAVLRWFSERAPETPVIAFVPHATASVTVEALKSGAADYIGKPFTTYEPLRVLVRRTLENRRAGREREFLRDEVSRQFACDTVIARDPGMMETIAAARRAAGTGACVLLTGESGTGKEALARFVHANSPRAGRAFVALRCGTLAADAIPGALFGAESGGPGGTAAQQAGRLEQAHLGTLYLESVCKLDAQTQANLLRFLEHGSFEHVGGSREMRADVRLIASNCGKLAPLVSEKLFGADLYRRLAEISLNVPPLRERRGDIPVLARAFLSRAAACLEKPDVVLAPSAERALLRYDWPGNGRELRNVMERVALICSGPVEDFHIPALQEKPREKPLLWSDIERQAIEEALRMTGGNRTRAARQLGMSLRTLQYRLKDWGAAG